ALARIRGHQRQAAERRLDDPSQAVVEAHRGEVGGALPTTASPVAASINWSDASRMKTRLLSALKRSRPSCRAPMTAAASALPLVATALIPSIVSSKLSAVKR